MKKDKSQSRDWFRIENAHKDDENATDAETHIYIYGEIGDSWWGDSTSANDFVKLLSGIKSAKIIVHLNSPGGSIFDGIAIYNALRDHSAEVEVRIDALAASAASFIAQAGDKVVMTAAATMMIHDGSTGAYGDAAYLRETADILDKLSNTVAGIYARRAGEDVDFWRALMIQEIWYNAEEAVAAGLADEVDGDTDDAALEDAKNKWDLSIFNHAGRNAAPDPMETRRRIANQLKEAPVAKPVQNNEGQPEGTPPAPPTTQPPADEPEGTETAPEGTDPEGTEPEPEGTPEGTDPQPEPAPAAGQPDNKADFTPKNVAGQPIVFMVNGVETTDPQVVQSRINVLENFRNETLTQARKDFVAGLAASKQVLQSQVPKLEAYALGLPTDEAFMAWKATYDDVPSISMLETHGGSENQPGRQTEAAENADTKLQDAKEILKHHKMGGMKPATMETLPSYKLIIAAEPNFKITDL